MLHPPLLRSLGVGRKLAFGPATRPLIRLLAAANPLRGHLVDPFRWAEVRREERRLIGEYEEVLDGLSAGLSGANLGAAAGIAALPDLIRGYEGLKLQRIAEYRTRLRAALQSVAIGEPAPR